MPKDPRREPLQQPRSIICAALTKGLTASMALGLIPVGGRKFGIAIKYRFGVDVSYPRACATQLQKESNGVYGYTGQYNSFTCNHGNGMNTSTNCYFASASYSHGNRNVID